MDARRTHFIYLKEISISLSVHFEASPCFVNVGIIAFSTLTYFGAATPHEKTKIVLQYCTLLSGVCGVLKYFVWTWVSMCLSLLVALCPLLCILCPLLGILHESSKQS